MKIIKQFGLLLLGIVFTFNCGDQKKTIPENQNSLKQLWKVIGPGGGGGVLKPTISPFNENFVMTHCDMTGVYISDNGAGRLVVRQ